VVRLFLFDLESPQMITRAVDRFLAGQRWLDRLGGWLQKVIAAIYGGLGPPGRALKDLLNGTWLGHQLHPVITDVPVGAWTLGVVFDIAYLATHRAAAAADWTILIGLIAAFGAVITGYTEFVDTADRELRYGIAHGLLNTVVVVLYLISVILRFTGTARGLAIGLAFIGYLVLTVAAFLGGELVANIGYGVNHHAFQSPPTDWTPALMDTQLAEAKLTRAQVEGVPILLYRRGPTILAISETCSHAGGPLSEGKVDTGRVICPWHASRFDLITGRVKGGPATINAVRYDVRVENGRIEVKRSAETLQQS